MKTEITRTNKNNIVIKGNPIKELMDENFEDILCLIYNVPCDYHDSFKLIVKSFADHGTDPLSTKAFRYAASTRASFINALMSWLGVFSGDNHGGSLIKVVEAIEKGKYIGNTYYGLGHPIHDYDPRVIMILDTLDCSKDGVHFIMQMSHQLNLCVNLAGISAAAMYDMRIPKEIMPSVFIISRLPYLSQHYLEQLKEKPKTI